MNNTTLKADILGQQYLIPFPNVSQTMEIETMRHALTDGRYGEMATNRAVKSTMANLDLVDAISTFTVLLPGLKTKLADQSIKNLDMATGLKLVFAYTQKYLPWYNKQMEEINKELRAAGFLTEEDVKPNTTAETA